MMDDTQQYQIRSSFTSYYQTVSVYKWYWVHFRCCHSTIMTCKNLPLHFEHSNCTYMVTFPLDNVVIYHYHTDDECYRWPHDQRVDVWLCYNWWWITSVTILSTFTTRMLLRSCHWILLPSILYWLIALIPYHTILQWVNVYVRFNGELFRWWFSL